MERITLLIADDHTLFRDGLRALFASIPDVEIAGEAATGVEVVALAASVPADVVLMDIQMPDMNGIEATRRILAANPALGIIVVTMFEDDESVFAAMRAGARGYVLKGGDQEEMLRAIRAVARGEALFGPGIAARLTHFFATSRATLPAHFPDLTDRERELLDLIARGHPNPEIAHRLGVTIKTVRNHLSNIYAKLQVADRAEAIVRARKAGMGEK